MELLFDEAPCGLITLNDSGKILAINQTLARWLNYDPVELIGTPVESLFTVATKVFYSTHFFPLLKLHTRADEVYLTLRTKRGDELPVLASGVRKDQGQILCAFIPMRERSKYENELLSARRTAEKGLRENSEVHRVMIENRTRELDVQYRKVLAMNDDLVQFTKIISHDVQESIRKIFFNTDLIARQTGTTLPSATTRALDKIKRATEQLYKLFRNLQEYLVIGTSNEPPTLVDLNAALSKAREEVFDRRGFSDFTLTSDPLPTVEGQQTELEHLFYHVLDNALQFRDPARKLEISVHAVLMEVNEYKASPDQYKFSPHVRIAFSDNGIGFDRDYEGYVFDLLRKLDPATTGAGMGLPLIKKVVENHHGSVKIKSAPGKGSTIVMILPLRLPRVDPV